MQVEKPDNVVSLQQDASKRITKLLRDLDKKKLKGIAIAGITDDGHGVTVSAGYFGDDNVSINGLLLKLFMEINLH